MSEHLSKEGQCICKAVTIKASNVSPKMGACHCEMCTKWTSGPYLALDCGTDITISGEENISIFNSSDWAERGFCKVCGTNLFYKLKQNQQYIVSLGLFDNKDSIIFDHQIFIDKKSSLYSFKNKTNDMTEAEVFAKFAPPATS